MTRVALAAAALWSVSAWAAPQVELAGCDSSQLNAQLVRGMLGAQAPGSDASFVVTCLAGSAVQVRFGAVTRTATLSGDSVLARSRVLSLLLLEFLDPRAAAVRRPDAAARPVEGRRADAGTPPQPRDAGAAPDAGGLADAGAPGDAGARGLDAGALSPPDAGDDAGAPPADAGPLLSWYVHRDGGGDGTDTSALPASPDLTERDGGVALAQAPDDTGAPDAGAWWWEPFVGRAIEVAILPGLDTSALFGGPAWNTVALGLIGVRSARISGAAVAPIALVSGDVTGAEVGVVSTAGSVHGLQLGALFGWSERDVEGVQLGVGGVRARKVTGLQLGFLSFSTEVTGVQAGGMNVTGPLTGVQVGLVNVASHVKGLQVGMVNVSDDADVPLGIFNFIKDTPPRFSLMVGDSMLVGGAARLGGRHLYTLISAGWTPGATLKIGGGLGTQITIGTRWWVDVETFAHALIDVQAPLGSPSVAAGLGVNVGLRVYGRLGAFLGPQLTFIFTRPGVRGANYSITGIQLGDTTAIAPGFQAGLSF